MSEADHTAPSTDSATQHTASSAATSTSSASGAAASATATATASSSGAPRVTIPDDASPEEREAAEALIAADEIESFKAEIATLTAKVAEFNDQWLRAQADVANARRRADDEVSKARKYAVESFAEGMLPVLDSLEASLLIKDASPEQIKEGAQATLRQLKSALERSKVMEIDPTPTESGPVKFDPTKHQAISMVPAEQEANTVVAVLQKGYSISDRVLRPALVTVSAPPL